MKTLSNPLRVSAFIIGISSILATLILIIIRAPILGVGGSYFSTFWELARYFTILVNFIVSIILIEASLRGYWRNFSLFTAATVWIWIVGVIYHLLLAGGHNPTGIGAVTNQIHHSVVPFGAFLIWILTKSRDHIPMRAPFLWLIFPIFYTVYVLLRGQLDNQYPYDFSNPNVLGWGGFLIAQTMFLIFFLCLGLGFRYVSNLWLKRNALKALLAESL